MSRRRVLLGQARVLDDVVMVRVVGNPEPQGLPQVVDDDTDSEVPFPGKTFTVAVTHYLDYRAPRRGQRGNGHFASYGFSASLRKLGPQATWEEIATESNRVNRTSRPCFGLDPEEGNVYFEGGALHKGVFYVFFGS
jgi:hypothetical protein